MHLLPLSKIIVDLVFDLSDVGAALADNKLVEWAVHVSVEDLLAMSLPSHAILVLFFQPSLSWRLGCQWQP